MFRKMTVCFTLICFIVCIHGCTSKYRIRDEEFKSQKEYKWLTVVTVDDEVYYFDSGAYFVDDHIECCADDSTYVQIPVEDVKLAYVRNFDVMKTVYYTLGVTFLVTFIGLIMIGKAIAEFFDQ